MKSIAIFFGVLITVLAAGYIVLFTPPGNTLLAPLIEKQIDATLTLKTRLKQFDLSSNSFAIELQLSEHNSVKASGSYSLFDQSLDADYQLKADELKELQALTQTPLYGSLHTQGSVKGDLDRLTITGSSDLAGSDTTYDVTLTSFSPTSIKAQVRDAQVASLLTMVGQKPYSSADLSANVDLRSIDPKAMDGELSIKVLDGVIDTRLMREDLNLSLPETAYTIKLESRLDGTTIHYDQELDSNLAHISSKGSVDPDPLVSDVQYQVDVKELALFKPLTDAPLRGPFATQGSIKGTKAAMRIKGASDIAESKTTYDVLLDDFRPQKVIASITRAKVDKLLYMVGEPEYATGDLDMDMTLDDLDPEHLRGDTKIRISKGTIDPEVMKASHGITLPKTRFDYDLDAKLGGKSIDYTTLLSSNLVELDSEGIITPKSSEIDLEYHLSIARLELLRPITNAPLRGALQLNGSAKGDKEELTLLGRSDLAKSDTTFTVKLKEFAPKSIHATVKRLQLKEMLYMVSQPDLANALIDVDVDITDAKAGELGGEIVSQISHGTLNSAVVAKEYAFKTMPKVTFRGRTKTLLNGDLIDTQAELISTLADVTVKKARVDLSKGVTTSDYQAKVHDLDRLYFATERHLKGKMRVTGELRQDDHLKLTAHSKTLGGQVDARLYDDDFHADLKAIQTTDTLHMLIYPEFFSSALDGKLDYDLKKQQGHLDAKLSKGHFTQNEMLDLVKGLGKLDLYKEKFTGTLKSQIDKALIHTDLDLRSNRSSITGRRVRLDSKKRVIDAKLDIDANNNPLSVTIKGKVDDPDVKLDASKIIGKEASKLIEKEAGKQLDRLFKSLF